MSRSSQAQVHRPNARRSGRWSPPLWGCYEYQTSGSEDEHDSDCETCSGSENDSGSEREKSEGDSESDEDETEEERARRMKEKRKGKQPEGSSMRKKERREPVYRPILTIRKSQGFLWNQDLFLPPYIRDRYVATSPPNTSSIPQHATPASADSSFSGMDFEIECVDIHVDGSGIRDLIPPSKKDE
ncbi:hypothetical protein RhiJN_17654 [Ceratobasidium sp. AG-Ba]|nr:hypothetical protein RhiJN_17654 [Ceratobasidium sp. AG-Ba]